jgi:hypothetical protein
MRETEQRTLPRKRLDDRAKRVGQPDTQTLAATVAWVRNGDRSSPDGALRRPGPWAPLGAAIVESGAAGRPRPCQRGRRPAASVFRSRPSAGPHEATQGEDATSDGSVADGARRGLPGAQPRACERCPGRACRAPAQANAGHDGYRDRRKSRSTAFSVRAAAASYSRAASASRPSRRSRSARTAWNTW